ncbi:MAG: glycosyl hydrolase family 28-related protein [Parafilimonas sp.]
MMKKITLISFLVVAVCFANAQNKNDFFNVKSYGAKADGKTLDGKAINQAISAAAKAGGGTVYFPAGNYFTGAIHLQSNITLYIDNGATIIAAPVNAANGYDEEEPGPNNEYEDAGHKHWHNSLIWGDSLHDIAIIGQGLINGKNLFKDWTHGDKQSANKAIGLVRCRNVIIKDISILHGGWFGILATGVDNFTLDNVKFDTNRDGVDVDCCHNVRISNCFVNSPYDDGICLKSSFALGYFRSTENVTITNCQVSGYDEGTLLDGTYKRTDNPHYHFSPTGRIKFGTESNGGFKNITISNCVFDYCRGLALESVDGALLEDVTINNITMRDVVNDPIFIRLGARMRGPANTPVGEIRRVIISNIVSYNSAGNYACTISGIPGHDVDDITLSNIKMYFKGGDNKLSADSIPEKTDQYPEPGMFGANPAYGMFIRHAKNIKLSDVEFNFLNDENRPAFYLNDVKGVYMFHVTPQQKDGVASIVKNNISDIIIVQSPALEKD